MASTATIIPTMGFKRWTRFGFQLGGGLVFAVALPVVLWMVLEPRANFGEQTQQAIAGSLVALLIGSWLFRNISQFPGVEGSSNILTTLSVAFGTVVAYFFAMRLEYVRAIFISSYVLSIVWFYIVYFASNRMRPMRAGVVPYGCVDRLRKTDTVTWVPLAIDPESLQAYDLIVADLAADLPDDWERLIADASLRGVPVYAVKHLLESLTGEVEMEHLSENAFGSLIPASAYVKIKYLIDMVVSILLLPVLLVLAIPVILAIKIDDPGPAFFRQKRMGYRGRAFKVLKFRTMRVKHPDSDCVREAAMTKDNDMRVTRIGRFLRTSRIDELPQIVNVLLGEMSWIGPRPEAIPLSQWYESEIPFYRYRHIVRPGVTGWAQVNQGHVADVAEVQTKLNYDFYYIKYFSPWLDLMIVARTARTMLTGFGSR